MKSTITLEMWHELETILVKLNAGYNVIFDNHHGTNEMIIEICTLGVMRTDIQKDIALAGKYKSNNRKPIPSNFSDLYNKYESKKISKNKLAKQLNISVPTLNKWIAQEIASSTHESLS